MNYNNQYQHITVILNYLNLSLIHVIYTHIIEQSIQWLTNFTKIIK